jgi:SRSO17 transposase
MDAMTVQRLGDGLADYVGDVFASLRYAGWQDRAGQNLALKMIDELLGWGLRPSALVADAGYGDPGEFRQSLGERDIEYAMQVAHTVTAYPLTVERTTAPYRGDGSYPKKIYRQPAGPVRDLLMAAGPQAARRVTWRDSSRRRAGRHHHTTLVCAAHAFLTL